eukprot:11267281-Alexandrium_andersonii.AAC.1
MSASLVGSEMCIRDRNKRQGEAATGLRPPMGLAAAHVRTRLGSALPACPVSYTHLTLPTICSV